MKTAGRPRRKLIERLCPDLWPRVDVGADHAHVAHALDAIASERMPNRRGRTDVPWVVADGLKPYKNVGVAIICGMGAKTIARILGAVPKPRAIVVHAQDDPIALRQWLSQNGWRIEDEGLAPEARRFAEVLRAVPGVEPSTGIQLDLGPILMSSEDPFLSAHIDQILGYWSSIAAKTKDRAPDVAAKAMARVSYLEAVKERRNG